MRLLVRASKYGVLFAFLASLVVSMPPAQAQEPPPKADELERLVSTLENDADRARLVTDLKALIAAQRKAQAPQEGNLMAALSERVREVGDDVLDTVGALRDAPKLANWIATQSADPEARGRWTKLAGVLALVLLAGWAADQAAAAALSRLRRRAAPPAPGPLVVRVPLGLARASLDLLPIAAFVGVSFGLITVMQVGGNLRLAALTLVVAYAAVRALVAVARMLLAPHSPTLRLLAVDDETAEYLVLWTRRLAGVGIFGWLMADAARLLGLPRSGFNAVTKGVGLALAAMLVVFILQNRAAVGAAMRRAADRWSWGRRLQGATDRLAETWHVLALAYVAGVYVVWAIPVRGGFEYILQATALTVLILAVAAVLSTVGTRLINRGFAVGAEAAQRLPHLEARANRYLPVLHLAFRSVVIAVTVLAVLQAWGLATFGWVASDLGRHILGSAITILAVVAAALALWEVVSGAIERYLAQTDGDGNIVERSSRARTLLPLARNALFVVLVVMVGLIVLAELGVNIAPLLAGAGVIGIAIGFGSQKLVQDVITGAFILFEDTIAVGDVVKLDGHSGLVEAMTIRAIRLRDVTGSVHTVPFSSVGTVINMTKDFSYAVIDAGVAYREDTDEVTKVLVQLGEELQADAEFGPLIVEPLEVLGVDRFDASAVVIRVRFKTLPTKQWSVTREFNRRMKRRFDELGIEIPFPQTTVWFGEDRGGKAPPLRLERTDEVAAN